MTTIVRMVPLHRINRVYTVYYCHVANDKGVEVYLCWHKSFSKKRIVFEIKRKCGVYYGRKPDILFDHEILIGLKWKYLEITWFSKC